MDIVGIFEETDALVKRVGHAGWRTLREAWMRARGLRRVRLRTVAVMGFVAFMGSLGLWLNCGLQGCPDVGVLVSFQPEGAARILDREGRTVALLRQTDHGAVSLDELPEHLPEAFLAIEDRRFYDHDGVDLLRVPGAFLANLRAGEIVEGASTVTMQLARNAFPERLPYRQKSLWRKLVEMRVASRIEDRFEKREILELYLNHIYFGNGVRGVADAARHYFDKETEDLDLAESALLAALPRAPEHYEPRRHPERAERRRDLVLDLLLEQGRIDPDRVAAAREQSLGVSRRPPPRTGERAAGTHFVEHVRDLLTRRFGERIHRDRLRVFTTLDLEAQRIAEEELERQLGRIEAGWRGRFRHARYDPGEASPPEEGYLQGALVLLEPGTGDVLAHVGGRDPGQSLFDRVTRGWRQVGSAFKPFVLTAALESGLSPFEPVADAPLRVALDGRRSWEPANFSGRFRGAVPLRDALVHSINVPTVRVARRVGTPGVAAMGSRLGIRQEIPTEPSMALGTVSLSPLDLAAAYVPFATLGAATPPRFLLRVEDEEGTVLWEAERPERRTVLDPRLAFLVTEILSEAVDRGTGTAVRAAGYRGPVAGKTGTTSEGMDAWFVGYTPEVTGTVWVGFDRPRPIVAGATGGGLAAPVWGRVMRRLYEDRSPAADWAVPAGLVSYRVDPASGWVLQEGCVPVRGAALEGYARPDDPVGRRVCPARPGERWRRAARDGDAWDRLKDWLDDIF